MTRFKRSAAAVGAAALLALTLTACGDDGVGGGSDAGDAPDNASKEEFCDAVNTLGQNTTGETPTEEEWEEFQGQVEDLAEIGTPEGIDEDARKGYELFVQTISDLEYGDVEDAGDNFLEEEFSKEEQDQFLAFFTYAGTECAEVPTDVPSELETE